jgi:hypothetical protein
VGHTLRSSVLLRVEVSWARVSWVDLKSRGGPTAGDARGTIAEVASSPSCRWMGRYDRLYRTLLSQNHRFLCIRP